MSLSDTVVSELSSDGSGSGSIDLLESLHLSDNDRDSESEDESDGMTCPSPDRGRQPGTSARSYQLEMYEESMRRNIIVCVSVQSYDQPNNLELIST
jgi:hypothetical protein